MHDRQSRTCIMVLGMHRSGTSALTRVLNLAGADLGSEMITVGDDNPHGFWEHRNACALHETLLAELGSSWYDVRALPVGWQESAFAEKARASIRQLIMDEFSEKALWAIKDPRMCRLAPLWIDVLSELGIRPAAVLALRHPEEVAASIHKRNGLTKQHSYLMWAQHEFEAFTSVINLPHVVVNYNELLESPMVVLDKISTGLDLQWQTPIEEAREPILDFLLDDEKHHHVSHFPDDIERSAGWAIDKLYRIFSAQESQSALHALCESYNYLTPLYSEEINSLTAELRKSRKEGQKRFELNDDLQRELSNLRVELSNLNTERGAAIAKYDATERQRADLEQKAIDFERERDELTAQLAATREELDSLSKLLDYTRTELDKIKAASHRVGWLVKKIWTRILHS